MDKVAFSQYGTELPEYTHAGKIMVKFTTLKSAKVSDSKNLKVQTERSKNQLKIKFCTHRVEKWENTDSECFISNSYDINLCVR